MMGFPLRSNIFKYGTHEQKYFSKFPVQIAVLFSPNDRDFVDAFKSLFLVLDKLTADEVAFFAVLDPPQDWLEEAKHRPWWQEYQNRIGQSGFSVQDQVLIKEIARLFGVGWGKLPQIVVSTNLWTAEFVTFPTSANHIEEQFKVLTRIVDDWGEPNLDQLAESLSNAFGAETVYHPPDDALRYRFSRVYGVLDSIDSPNRLEQYQRFLESDLHQVDETLKRLRRREDFRGQPGSNRELDEPQDSASIEDIIEDAAGRLVAPATVAMRIAHWSRQSREREVADMLEEESLIMAETALTLGDFLESLRNGSLRGISPLQLGTRGRRDARWYPLEIDFTPCAQGAWKAFELEINLSIIQAARASIAIKMPEYFTIYDSGFVPHERSRIATGTSRSRPVYKDINQRDRETRQTGQHRFLPLGDAFNVAQALRETQEYEAVIFDCLGRSFPSHLYDTWRQVQGIRNKGSHTDPLSYNDYKTIIEDVLSLDTLEPLTQIKRVLSIRRVNKNTL
jgi:hypothetical protein